MIHGLIYNPQHLGTLGEYFSLNLFPKSLELSPTSPRNTRKFKTGVSSGGRWVSLCGAWMTGMRKRREESSAGDLPPGPRGRGCVAPTAVCAPENLGAFALRSASSLAEVSPGESVARGGGDRQSDRYGRPGVSTLASRAPG